MVVCDNPSRSAACQNSQTSSSGTNNHVTFTVTIIAFLPSSFCKVSLFEKHNEQIVFFKKLNQLLSFVGGDDVKIWQRCHHQNCFMFFHENSHEVDQPQHAHSSEVRLGVVSLESNVPPLFGDPGLQLDGRHQQLPQLWRKIILNYTSEVQQYS